MPFSLVAAVMLTYIVWLTFVEISFYVLAFEISVVCLVLCMAYVVYFVVTLPQSLSWDSSERP